MEASVPVEQLRYRAPDSQYCSTVTFNSCAFTHILVQHDLPDRYMPTGDSTRYHQPAIDHQNLACNETAGVGRQKQGGP